MSEGLEINAEIGLCTKDMAKENPIKDFEILIEENKNKWSKQMYDYFKECLSIIEKELRALEIIRNKQIDVGLYELDYKTINSFELTKEEYDLLKEVLL